MTTIQKQIAERICALVSEAVPGRADGDFAAGARQMAREITTQFVSGKWDDILGKPEPTINDVREEARRVFGAPAYTVGGPRYVTVHSENEKSLKMVEEILAPTIASAYAALRALPSKVEG